ncbi:MAG TPA: hypothetical protein VGI78_04700 [Acetobacteraceae bacterium]
MTIMHNVAKRKLQHGDVALGFGLHHLRGTDAGGRRAARLCVHGYGAQWVHRTGGDADMHRLLS